MKKILSIIAVLLVMGLQVCYAQKNQPSDYNLRKAIEFMEKNEGEEALKYVNLQIQDTPKSSDAYMLRSAIYNAQEKYGSALTDVNTAIKYWNKNNLIKKYALYWHRADIYQHMGMLNEAVEDYGIAYKCVSKRDGVETVRDILYDRANAFYNIGDLEKADVDFKLMLKYNEADQAAMLGLVRNMIRRDNYDEAIDLCNKCKKYDNTYGEIYLFRMQAYDKKGYTDLAIDDAFRYVHYSAEPELSHIESILKKHLSYSLAKVNGMAIHEPDDIIWNMLRINIYEWGHDYLNAIAEYNNIEKEYGATQDLYYHRSECYDKIGDTERAIADITKCIEMGNGKDYYALAQRADIYRGAGFYKEAIADYSMMIEFVPTKAYPYYQRGWCYELSGDDRMAMENYNAGIDVDKSYPYIYLMRGELRLKRGENESANVDFEEILKKDTIAEEGSCRQYALHFLNRNDEAVEWMEKIIANDPENSGIYYDKACLYARMGKTDEALVALRVALEKGYRSFAHIENDDDIDPIRNLSEFIELINKYKNNSIATFAESDKSADEISAISEIDMKKMYSGVYEVECNINGLPLKSIFDTGASTISISSVEASFMLKNGYLKEEDIKGKEYFSTATGEIHEGTIIRLREIKIGDAVLRNVDAAVAHNLQAPILLGQSVLERFGTITIDNINSKLIIKQ